MNSRMIPFLLTALALHLALPAWAEEKPAAPASSASAAPAVGARKKLPAGYVGEWDVEYIPGGGVRNTLDVVYPAAASKPLPLVVYIHGGGWKGGSKNNPAGAALARFGFVTASLNYRFSQQAVFPAQLEDCKAALRWLRARAEKYHFDPKRVGVWGHSAGGHLVALLGTTGDVREFDRGENLDQSSRVQAVCDFFGPSDFSLLTPENTDFKLQDPKTPYNQLLGGLISEKGAQAKLANPITYVTRDDAPFLIFHGDADRVVPLVMSQALEAALRQGSVPVTLKVIEKGKHGGAEFLSPAVTDAVVDFFTRELKAPAPK